MKIPLLISLPLLLAVSCGRKQSSQASAEALKAISVKVQAAKLEPHVAEEEVVGTVRSKLRAMVEAKVSGRVLEYLAIPGTTVKSGDLLARLEVQEIQAKVDQAKALLDQAQRDFARQQQLMSSNATTRQEYESFDARLKVSKAALSEAETMMSYARITAPFDGVITRKLADVGDLAMPGKPLLEIEAPTSLRFEADLPEAILDRITMGAKMKVKVASVAEALVATVSEIAPVADPVSRTFQVRFDLPGAPGLRSGQFGRVAVPVAEAMILRIPREALIKRGQMEVVFIARDQHAALRLVKTGKAFNGTLEVLSGIEEGEQVIVSDVEKLTDGQPVSVLKP